MVILVVFNQQKCNTPLKNMRVFEFLKKKFSEAMKEIIKAYLLIYQNTCSTSESRKKVL